MWNRFDESSHNNNGNSSHVPWNKSSTTDLLDVSRDHMSRTLLRQVSESKAKRDNKRRNNNNNNEASSDDSDGDNNRGEEDEDSHHQSVIEVNVIILHSETGRMLHKHLTTNLPKGLEAASSRSCISIRSGTSSAAGGGEEREEEEDENDDSIATVADAPMRKVSVKGNFLKVPAQHHHHHHHQQGSTASPRARKTPQFGGLPVLKEDFVDGIGVVEEEEEEGGERRTEAENFSECNEMNLRPQQQQQQHQDGRKKSWARVRGALRTVRALSHDPRQEVVNGDDGNKSGFIINGTKVRRNKSDADAAALKSRVTNNNNAIEAEEEEEEVPLRRKFAEKRRKHSNRKR